jgi:hypothetical protein
MNSIRLRTATARESLRRRYRPKRVRILFVGESPPASGRFFYAADSGLYRAVRGTFLESFPKLESEDFLRAFSALGCYLVDLCGSPVDKLNAKDRRQACVAGETQLSRTIKQLRPEIIVTVVRSIAANVVRAQTHAGWEGTHLALPYPGRWQRNRGIFKDALIPVLRKEFIGENTLCAWKDPVVRP